ncbi:hypothetical protein GPA19_05220 [Azoarcus indigens]|uniref:Uncharacterized protein n=1 Tax=Azoarcus indigens TaxID=29545 RepID=A0A4R6DVL6_9RHOO|nr:hypothetical protein [Azoarcus indigens]NMG64345.1 hypothetical protein [Azoarcus indigens]TDN49203.1 hypothetical protein C7389_11254 [Azoarcus indigens]
MLLTQYGPGDPATWSYANRAGNPNVAEDARAEDDRIEAIACSKFRRLAAEDWDSEKEAVIDEAEADDDLFFLARLAAAAVTGPLAVHLILSPICRDRLEARCMAEARIQFEQECKESEEDYYRRRVEG